MAEKILTYEDILKIGTFLCKEGYEDRDITIRIGVKDKALLEKLNEDFYYRTTQPLRELNEKEGANKQEIPPITEGVGEISVNVGNIVFNYVLKPEVTNEKA